MKCSSTTRSGANVAHKEIEMIDKIIGRVLYTILFACMIGAFVIAFS